MAATAVLDIRFPFSTREQTWTRRLQINGWDSALNRRYADALVAELEANADEFADVEIRAVRLGGGRASHIGGEALWQVMRTVRKLYHLAPDAPVSMRCAAADFSGASMPYFKRSGVGRFDLEMLSLSSTAFNRVNNTDSLDLYPVLCNSFLHSQSNDSLGIVLLCGSPQASDIEVRRSFLEAKHYNVSHVIVECFEGNASTDEAKGAEGKAEGDSPAVRCAAQVADGRELLKTAGFREYAPLHFARPGCEDRYFETLRDGTDVIGIGLGARTVFDGAFSVNTSDLDIYLTYPHDFTKITVSAGRIGDGK